MANENIYIAPLLLNIQLEIMANLPNRQAAMNHYSDYSSNK